jgi:23S rRNA pseudouridine2605 synthase
MEERLQKIIARAGVASRRHAEELIRSGQVTVNGKVVTELGTRADAARDHIKVSGRLLRNAPELIYVALNKPSGCVSAMSDPEGRPTVRPFLRTLSARLFPVGVLDYHAQGLLLLTNDGALTNRLMREPGRLAQVFWVKLKGRLQPGESESVSRETGLRLRLVREGDNPWYEVRLAGQPGRGASVAIEQLRTALVALGHPLEKQRRTAYGPLELGRLQPGEFRILQEGEVRALLRDAGQDAARAVQGTLFVPAGRLNGRRPEGKRHGPRRSAADSRSGRYSGGRGGRGRR